MSCPTLRKIRVFIVKYKCMLEQYGFDKLDSYFKKNSEEQPIFEEWWHLYKLLYNTPPEDEQIDAL